MEAAKRVPTARLTTTKVETSTQLVPAFNPCHALRGVTCPIGAQHGGVGVPTNGDTSRRAPVLDDADGGSTTSPKTGTPQCREATSPRGSPPRRSRTDGQSWSLCPSAPARRGECNRAGYVAGADRVGYVAGADRVSYVADAPRVSYVAGADRVDYVAGADRVSYVADATRVSYVAGADRVDYVAGIDRVSYVADAPRVSYVAGADRDRYVPAQIASDTLRTPTASAALPAHIAVSPKEAPPPVLPRCSSRVPRGKHGAAYTAGRHAAHIGRSAQRVARQIDALPAPLETFTPGITPFPAWAAGAQPDFDVGLGSTHVAAMKRRARAEEGYELQHGDREHHRQSYDFADARPGAASSASTQELLEAHPGFGNDLEGEHGIRRRLEMPVLEYPLCQSVERNYLRDHLAGGCVLCETAARYAAAGFHPRCSVCPIAGFHPQCYALRFYTDFTRGCRVRWETSKGPPPPIVKTNYPSLGEYPRSAAAGFMKHARSGAFGWLNGKMLGRTPPHRKRRTRYDRKFSDRAYREAMPRAEVSNVRPERCAPLGAAVRFADRVAAELAGVSPKARIIYDLTAVRINAATARWRFRYAGIDALRPHLTKGSYCASFDLSAMYCQVPVDAYTSKFFNAEVPPLSAAERVELGVKGPGPHYVRYRTLPMGWKSACAHASVLTAAVCEEAQRRGAYCAVSYIDDVIITGRTYAECARSQAIVKKVIEEQFGLVLNEGKTEGPQRLLTWIGIEVDTANQQFTISADRRNKIASEIEALLAVERPSVAKLRSCLGRLSWLSMLMRGARAYSSPIFGAIKWKKHTDRVLLTARHIADLQWFVDHLRSSAWKGSAWLRPSSEVVHTKSDAGDDAVFLVAGGRFVYHRLTEAERALSSHARELLPSVIASRVFGPEWRGKIVAMMFDNSGTAYSVSSGSSRTDDGARDMLRAQADLSLLHDFELVGVWGPRSANVLCDAGSKVLQEMTSTRPLRIEYSAKEIAAATLPTGAGCWLYPTGYYKAADAVVGYIRGDEARC